MFYLYILLIIYYTLGIARFIYIAKYKTKYRNKVININPRPTLNKRKSNYRLDVPLLGNNLSNSSLNKSSEDSLNYSDNKNQDLDPNKILELKEKKVSFNTNDTNNSSIAENHFY